MGRKRKTKGKRTRVKGGRRREGREAVTSSSKIGWWSKGMGCCRYPPADLEQEAPGTLRAAARFHHVGADSAYRKETPMGENFPRQPGEGHPPGSERIQY